MIAVVCRQRQVTIAQQRSQMFPHLRTIRLDQSDTGKNQRRRKALVRTRMHFMVQRVALWVNGLHRAEESLRPAIPKLGAAQTESDTTVGDYTPRLPVFCHRLQIWRATTIRCRHIPRHRLVGKLRNEIGHAFGTMKRQFHGTRAWQSEAAKTCGFEPDRHEPAQTRCMLERRRCVGKVMRRAR
ncbi:MAG TPA: hypothetical protein PLP08_15560 [Plasticicumulans sp.]|uniref:hypothetical protein n=1 Tax=Plasticicumulans sp. TaxID=2307179 RepID=UPI002C77AC24|nr:hypothetical protein [Plasticicumulans sp.]HNG51005.1 hypothetical protein [Plasticicumulans sp.]